MSALSLALVLGTFVVLNILTFALLGLPLSPLAITGKAIDTGIVMISILDQSNIITIYSPENTTYNFSKGASYIIALNVSANFNVDIWRYSLYDARHGIYVEEDTDFTPNSSISAVRWTNILTVKAHETDGGWSEKNVTFYVEVPNSAPILMNMSDELFSCEGDNFNFNFNATDIDEEILTSAISPQNIFFNRFISYDNNVTSFFRIASATMSKGNAGGVGGVSASYLRTLEVYDDELLMDSKDVNITIIEVNNIPIVDNELGAQTVWLEGDNSTFYHQYNVSDIEDGETSTGNLDFNLTFVGIANVFDIGATDGIMNFTPDISHLGVYSIKACVEDNSLNATHQNFSICEAAGKRSSPYSVCDDFSLTVTDQNRAPLIVNYTPVNASFDLSGTATTYFYVEVRDPDGTIPDIDWYVDGNLREHNENMSEDNFSTIFGCGISGPHIVSIFARDGLLEDSFTWNINILEVDCPEESSGGGGGGGSYCNEDWACGDWNVCQNVKRSFDSEVLAFEDYNYMKEICAQNGYDDERFCGFQITNCIDINECNNTELRIERPSETQICYFTENPSCSDGITNCHDGACESLVDCGGPCGACPTCSDKKQNQGEEDVDCGGPCPYLCEEEVPLKSIFLILIVLAIVLTVLLAYFGYRLFLILRERHYS